MTDTAFLDVILADATGDNPSEEFLIVNPENWRRGIADLLDEARAEVTSINAEIKPLRRSPKKTSLEDERAGLILRISYLETRLRYVKGLIGNRRPVTDPEGNELQKLRQHLYAALDLLKILEQNGNQRDELHRPGEGHHRHVPPTIQEVHK